MDYELYHDESKRAGYWHGMLLVPIIAKTRLLNLLQFARDNTGYQDPIGIKKVEKKNSRIYTLALAWINIGVAALLQNFKGKNYHSFFGRYEKGKKIPEQFKELLRCKFILFREKDDHSRMEFHHDYGSKVETTFRMGLKGGLHFLGNQENPINIIKIHFDGHEHYNRKLDENRILKRLTDLKDFCSFGNDKDIIDDRSSNHNQVDSQEYDNCQLLQLTDLLVGGFRTYLGQCTRELHKELNHPIREYLID
jgi:hypothetical protein